MTVFHNVSRWLSSRKNTNQKMMNENFLRFTSRSKEKWLKMKNWFSRCASLWMKKAGSDTTTKRPSGKRSSGLFPLPVPLREGVCFQAAGDSDPHLIRRMCVTQICFYFRRKTLTSGFQPFAARLNGLVQCDLSGAVWPHCEHVGIHALTRPHFQPIAEL